MAYIFLLIGLAAILAGSIIDSNSSKVFQFHAQTEKTKLFRDENGFFHFGKYWLFTGVMVALYLIGGYVAISTSSGEGRFFVACMLLVFGLIGGGFRAWGGVNNTRQSQQNRTKQIELLKNAGAAAINVRRAKSGVWFGKEFGFLTSRKTSDQDAAQEIYQKFQLLALEPESNWFDKETIAKIEKTTF